MSSEESPKVGVPVHSPPTPPPPKVTDFPVREEEIMNEIERRRGSVEYGRGPEDKQSRSGSDQLNNNEIISEHKITDIEQSDSDGSGRVKLSSGRGHSESRRGRISVTSSASSQSNIIHPIDTGKLYSSNTNCLSSINNFDLGSHQIPIITSPINHSSNVNLLKYRPISVQSRNSAFLDKVHPEMEPHFR